jgi:hypothetical protein
MFNTLNINKVKKTTKQNKHMTYMLNKTALSSAFKHSHMIKSPFSGSTFQNVNIFAFKSSSKVCAQ